MHAEKPLLQMQKIKKKFPGVVALDGVSFDLYPGEVHTLVGENGAGKSTLMKILSGVYQPDEGKIIFEDKPIKIKDPRHAQEVGINIVHQELNLFQNLSVAENLFGGNMPSKGWLGFEDTKQAFQTTIEFLKQFDAPIDPRQKINRLSIAQQQVVEISKALARNTKVLILDEPTSSLTEHETKMLFKIIRRLKERGLCVVYISHRLDEIFQIGDRVTVLRDGKLVNTTDVNKTNVEEIIRMMVGRKLEDLYGHSAGKINAPILSVENISYRKKFQNICFQVKEGEILGVSGLVGAGRSEVGLALFGAIPIDSGKITLQDKIIEMRSPEQAMESGIAYLSENRQTDALFTNMEVRKNISVSHLEKFSRWGMLNSLQEKNETEQYIRKLNIQTPGTEQKVMKLSGGNQQKVVLARWLAIHPKVFIVDEPTRGIDVGAKVEIYTLIHKLAAEGVAIILISSEMPEILGMSDRIIVMHEGRITGELTRAEATEEKILALATSRAPVTNPS